MEKSKMRKGIELLIRFGYPCVDKNVRKEIKESLSKGIEFDTERLKKLFSNAFPRIKTLYPKSNPLDKMEDYWLKEGHNKAILEENVHHGQMAVFCRSREVEVILHEKGKYVVKHDNKQEVVLDDIVKDAMPGDKIWIHRGYAVYKP